MHSLSTVHFFSTLVARSLLSCSRGRGWMEGGGDDLRKWDMLIRAASARCAVKTETVVIITSLWLISHYLCLIHHHCWLYSQTHALHTAAGRDHWQVQSCTYSAAHIFKAYHAEIVQSKIKNVLPICHYKYTSSKGDVLMNVHAALFHFMKVSDDDL